MSYPTYVEESRLHGEFAAYFSTASEHARIFQVYPKSCSNWFVLLTIGVTLWRRGWLPDLVLPHILYASLYCEGHFEIYRPRFPFKIIIQIHLHLEFIRDDQNRYTLNFYLFIYFLSLCFKLKQWFASRWTNKSYQHLWHISDSRTKFLCKLQETQKRPQLNMLLWRGNVLVVY